MATRTKRALIKWLWRLSRSNRLATAANESGQAVVVLTGLLWASFLAAHFSSQSDDAMSAYISEALDASTIWFSLAIIMQLVFIFSGRGLVITLFASAIFVVAGAFSYTNMTRTMAYLSGANSVRYSDYAERSKEFQQCVEDKVESITHAIQRRDRLELYYEICQASVDSDLFHLRLASAENRLSSRDTANVMQQRTLKRCSSIVEQLKESDEEVRLAGRKECKMPEPPAE